MEGGEKRVREEVVIKGSKAFKDERGSIFNYEFDEPINWIGLIKTTVEKAGVMRANHYHPEQTQRVLITSGRYISVYKDLKDENSEIKHHLIGPGDLVITPPNIAHTMIFLEDTVLLNLVTGEREHENYGKHTISYELVKPEEAEGYLSKYK